MSNIKTSNFLSEVIATQEESLIIDIKQKIPVVTSKIKTLKYQVKSYIENNNLIQEPRNVNSKYLKQATALNEEMNQLMGIIEEVAKHGIDQAVLDIDNIELDLEECRYGLKLSTQLVTIKESIKKQAAFRKEKKYLESLKELANARKIILEIPKEEQLDIILIIDKELVIEREDLMAHLIKVWEEAVIINKIEKVDSGTTITTVKIDNCTHNIEDIIEAIYFAKTMSHLEKIASCLLKDILVPIINNNVDLQLYDEENFEILEVKYQSNSKKSNYRTVFDNISTVFDYFCCKINYNLTENLSFLAFIGSKIREQFCEVFIKNCLEDTVPTTQEGLEKYKTVVEEIEALQTSLVECNFFNREFSSILEYAGNIDILFANKVCSSYIEQVKVILKKDLHDMEETGDDPEDKNKKEIIFPKCGVSKSTKKFLQLVLKIVDQAKNSTEMCAGRLLCIAKNSFDMYANLVPEYHKKLLETIPQSVALFHNNCMYLSYKLITTKEFKVENIKKTIFEGESFDYQIQYLRKVGAEIFSKFTESQVKQIKEILNESAFATLGHIEKLDPNTEKYIRQCLRQLELLKTVWQKVLNNDMYNKTIGELLSAFLNYLIELVLDVEDISAETSTLLVDMFKVVETRGPKLFLEPKEINMYTSNWQKFKELIILLNANLNEINDRWSDGKGPLAVEYAPEEIKRMIRALFQNTERRAAILAKIN